MEKQMTWRQRWLLRRDISCPELGYEGAFEDVKDYLLAKYWGHL